MDTLKNLLSELTEIVNQNEIFKKEIIQLKKTNLKQQKEIEEIKQKYKTMQVTMGGHCKEKIRLKNINQEKEEEIKKLKKEIKKLKLNIKDVQKILSNDKKTN